MSPQASTGRAYWVELPEDKSRNALLDECSHMLDARCGLTAATLRGAIHSSRWKLESTRHRVRTAHGQALAKHEAGPALVREMSLTDMFALIVGRAIDERRIGEAVAMANDYALTLGNTLNRVLFVATTERQDYGDEILWTARPAKDFRPITGVQVGRAPRLPIVNEGSDYTQGSVLTEQGRVVGRVAKHGRISPAVSIDVVRNDDLRLVAQMIMEEGRAATETIADAVLSLWRDNALALDSVNWFHASHGNVGSDPLTATAVQTWLTTLGGSHAAWGATPQGLPRDGVALLVPRALQMTAYAMRRSPLRGGSVAPPRYEAITGGCN
jgi:hypothetical protein